MSLNLRIVLLAVLLGALAAAATGQEVTADQEAVAIQEAAAIEEVTAAQEITAESMEQLRAQIAAQQKALEDQSLELDEQRQRMEAQEGRLEDQRKAIQNLLQRVDEMAAAGTEGLVPETRSDSEIALRERLDTLEQQVANPPDQASEDMKTGDFPGSFRIPGTNTAMRIGGFVKLNYVQNLDPTGSDDRFIVATIPTGDVSGGEDSRSTLSTRESRFSFDVRKDSSLGVFRIFLEGDFAGADEFGGDDLYRLRHAYGQYKHLLIGKTWSTFMNDEARPEEIDFEGLNGNIFARQSQFRFRFTKGDKNSFFLSLEDPRPSVTNGSGISQFADFIAAFRRSGDRGHLRLGGVLRQLRAQPDEDATQRLSATGWGVAASGKFDLSSDSGDNFMFEMSYGSGHGRYINDLNAEGGQDAVYDPATDRLETLPAFSAFAAYQHWWGEVGHRLGFSNLRTTVVASMVDVNNLDTQVDSAYHRTFRTSINLMWSPLTSIDIGAEYLWGRRVDKDGATGSASQFQFATKYRF